MNLFLSAGEESGDLHASYLARELSRLAPGVELAGMGGARMREAGVRTLVASEGHGVVGFVEVIARFGKLRRDLNTLTAAMRERRGALVAVDYGGFNARLVSRAKRAGLKTFYYIPPKLWAWGKHRGRELARNLDLVLAVFPFEVPFWESLGVRVRYVGHPLLDITRPDAAAASRLGLGAGARYLLVMPGSRRIELANIWPRVAAALPAIMRACPDVAVVVAAGPAVGAAALERFAAVPAGVVVTAERAVDLMPGAAAAVAASGTATLELALVGTPALVLYRVNTLTWELGRRLVYVRHLGLPNIIAGGPIVPELLQGDVRPDNIAAETIRLLTDNDQRQRIAAAYAAVRAALVPPAADGATAPARAARLILETLAA